MQKKIRKYFIWVCLILMGSMALGVTQVWVSWEGESLFTELGTQWESETGEQVQIVYVPDLEEKLTITLKASGNLPDLCLIKNDNLPLILEYTEPVKTSEIEGLDYDFDERLSRAFIYRSESYVVPFYADMQLMYLSTKIFDRIGLALPDNDWTLEEFLQLMKTINARDIQPSGWGINSAYLFTGLQEGLGSPVIDEKGKINLLTQENMVLLGRYKE